MSATSVLALAPCPSLGEGHDIDVMKTRTNTAGLKLELTLHVCITSIRLFIT